MHQIICVHVGNAYSESYVEKLYNSCCRNTSIPFLFTVLTENSDYNIKQENFRTIKVIPYNFVNARTLWWYKMQAFRPDVAIEGQNLLLDIDQVIVNSLDKFFNYAKDDFVIIQDFNRQWNKNYNRSNSSVVKFTKSIATSIYDKWLMHPADYVRKYRGDQDWFDDEVADKTKWPYEWIKSWKWEVYKGGQIKNNSTQYSKDVTVIEDDCSILSFHGKPKPHDVDENIIKTNWI